MSQETAAFGSGWEPGSRSESEPELETEMQRGPEPAHATATGPAEVLPDGQEVKWSYLPLLETVEGKAVPFAFPFSGGSSGRLSA